MTAFRDETQHQPGRRFFAHSSPERAVLSHLLDQHPRRFTFQELANEVGSGFKEKAVRRAVDNLAAAQFIHREGATLTPAPAVVSFDREPSTTNF
jgi:DNA-binding Lrp family transcriptional regulator